jgi:hypothetical protein
MSGPYVALGSRSWGVGWFVWHSFHIKRERDFHWQTYRVRAIYSEMQTIVEVITKVRVDAVE